MWTALAAGAALSVIVAILMLFLPQVLQETSVTRRVRRLAARAPLAATPGSQAEMTSRVRAITARAPSRHAVQLDTLLAQAGLSWTRGQLYAGAGVTGCTAAALALAAGAPWPLAVIGGLAAAPLAPLGYIRHRRDRRFARFAEELPNALEIIVRGVRAGLPIHDCIRTVAREANAPVCGEFAMIEDEQRLGAAFSEAVDRLANRIPIEETRFLSIAIAVQSAEGGAIAETLLNLSRTLRERRRLANKIRAMTAEQTGSAKILAALPIVMIGAGCLLQPDHMGLLFMTVIGQVTLAICLIWIVIGFLVMARMTRFDI